MDHGTSQSTSLPQQHGSWQSRTRHILNGSRGLHRLISNRGNGRVFAPPSATSLLLAGKARLWKTRGGLHTAGGSDAAGPAAVPGGNILDLLISRPIILVLLAARTRWPATQEQPRNPGV
ncbi:hypothetical protein GGTG_13362 [Gaeumannomyces tritici R3-111a-1]|uniref:Uncharacterized protein n=1 Tax=Gaeumannomyces tritici (strain R3-111a-1) TaxID=644352 RepID=J3PIN3_GAET3|nr:hypothetical protein GGTG_13362 [Gaeumannomyces tritici R3-111a-1]EJT69094.1 hypothetical protein GGTG_13362 [Gaeumannomyces tritici R3-111a-1]